MLMDKIIQLLKTPKDIKFYLSIYKKHTTQIGEIRETRRYRRSIRTKGLRKKEVRLIRELHAYQDLIKDKLCNELNLTSRNYKTLDFISSILVSCELTSKQITRLLSYDISDYRRMRMDLNSYGIISVREWVTHSDFINKGV